MSSELLQSNLRPFAAARRSKLFKRYFHRRLRPISSWALQILPEEQSPPLRARQSPGRLPTAVARRYTVLCVGLGLASTVVPLDTECFPAAMTDSLGLKNGGRSACGADTNMFAVEMRSVLGKPNCSVHSPSSARGDGYVFLTTAVSSAGTSSSPQDASAVVPASSPLQNTQNDWTRELPDFSNVPSPVPLTSSAYSPVAPRATFHLSLRRPCRRLCLRRLPSRPPPHPTYYCRAPPHRISHVTLWSSFPLSCRPRRRARAPLISLSCVALAAWSHRCTRPVTRPAPISKPEAATDFASSPTSRTACLCDFATHCDVSSTPVQPTTAALLRPVHWRPTPRPRRRRRLCAPVIIYKAHPVSRSILRAFRYFHAKSPRLCPTPTPVLPRAPLHPPLRTTLRAPLPRPPASSSHLPFPRSSLPLPLAAHLLSNTVKGTHMKPWPGLFYTGDGAVRGEDGYNGRIKEVVNVLGHCLSRVETECAPIMLQGVADTAAVITAGELTRQAVYALMTLKPCVPRLPSVRCICAGD
ncbi:hypothetical protein FB451DRAFT_1415220 [Mycena latifolia]|nr:hypothetical protein FB451DRAFT_1415220 [Mycena latifolia]